MAAQGNIQISGGTKWKQSLEAVRSHGLSLQVGIMPEAQNSETGEPVAPYAFFNEYGLGGKPARPFMRNTISRETSNWADGFAGDIRGHVTERGIVATALDKLGGEMVAAIQETIEKGEFTPNSPATLLRKNRRGDPRRNMPLFDTGSLVDRSITYKVLGSGGAS